MSFTWHTYIISMPHQVLRRQRMVALMGRLRIQSFEFVVPIRRAGLVHYPEYARLPHGYASLNATVSGKIFDMHLARIVSGRVRPGPFLVFEDDAIERVPAQTIVPHIKNIVVYLETLASKRWDVVYLEYCMEHCGKPSEDMVVAPARYPFCTAATLYNSTSIPIIRNCLQKSSLVIDFAYAKCITQKDLRAFVSVPALFAQDATYGMGDLPHLSPKYIQWWLNLIIDMYPTADASGAPHPRLPACWNSSETLAFLRWERLILLLLIVIGLIMAIASALIVKVTVFKGHLQSCSPVGT